MKDYIKNFDQFNQSNEAQVLIKKFLQACDAVATHNKSPDADWQEAFNISETFQNWFGELLHHPEELFKSQVQFFNEFSDLCKNVLDRMQNSSLPPFISAAQDRRFKSHLWQDEPFYYFLQQSYLLFVKHYLKFVEDHPSQSAKITKQVSFFSKNYLDALSPTNFIFTNPDVIEQTLKSKGANLTHGLQNYFEDWIKGQGHFNISMSDLEAFEVGKNIAITPGKVVFQNEMMELIQYSPQTDAVHEVPLLIIPPWINKYYILDLQPKNSFVNWIVQQGYTVFIISWVNPDESYEETDFESYLFNGLLKAVDVVLDRCKSKTLNTLGFCIGGTLLSIALAYMHNQKDQRIASATFLTTLLDFSDAGDLQAFIDERQLKSLEERMEKQGYLDGRFLMTTFNLLRPNDLIWPYFINQYLCGKKPHPFDLLYWNCDSSNLPKKMTSFYLRNMYLNNKLANDALFIKNTRIILSTINTPSYFLSTENDHIAPWENTYLGAKALKQATFVLGGAGHIAGIINPPNAERYYYRVCDGLIDNYVTSEDWFAHSRSQKGSWWVHWIEWLNTYSGDLKKPSTVLKDVPGLKPAPGSYVRRRLV